MKDMDLWNLSFECQARRNDENLPSWELHSACGTQTLDKSEKKVSLPKKDNVQKEDRSDDGQGKEDDHRFVNTDKVNHAGEPTHDGDDGDDDDDDADDIQRCLDALDASLTVPLHDL